MFSILLSFGYIRSRRGINGSWGIQQRRAGEITNSRVFTIGQDVKIGAAPILSIVCFAACETRQELLRTEKHSGVDRVSIKFV
jgi:hypothetical protein